MVGSLIKKIAIMGWSKCIQPFAHQTNDELSNTLLIIGSTRSGTTLLMEMLNSQKGHRTIFEPFTPDRVSAWQTFPSRYFIHPDQAPQMHLNQLELILRGRFKSAWTDRYNTKLSSSYRIIKSVRGHFLFPAIEKHFPEVKMIYIKRKMEDVVKSRLKMGWPHNVDEVLSQKSLMAFCYPNLNPTETLRDLQTEAGKHALLWFLENQFLERYELPTVHYEDLIHLSSNAKEVLNKNTFLPFNWIERPPSLTSKKGEQMIFSHAELKDFEFLSQTFAINR